ncbi:tellurite resistance TerB family protein [Plesiomonas shigelloides]|uniref:tellurite resistance TerB family protein n=1 Tax=Plesiomonas shigelloides TaxID=703 RepID=UPI000A11B8EE|nr:TerB family tellurite resistance protein [Plesiomonas shigelloides]
MFGLFKKKTRKVVTEVKKMENRDAVEATVWGAYSIAYADGNCDAKEIAVLEKTIAALPAFSPFAAEIAQMSANIRARYEASPRSANVQALRELADVAGTVEAVDVLCLCIDIADQDGIGEQEEAVLKKIAQALQLPLDQYL